MKRNSLTLSQAHKLYTGNSMGKSALLLSLFAVLGYFASLLCIFLMSWLSEGNPADAMRELKGSVIINVFLAMDSGIILMITGLINYEKHNPGGKFFRSVNGGFDGYRKMKNAALINRLAALFTVMLLGALADILGITKLRNGTSDVIYIAAWSLIGVALVNFMGLVKNPALRGLFTPPVVFAAELFGLILPSVFDGNPVIALAAAAAAVPLIILSQNVMLNDYKKNHWK